MTPDIRMRITQLRHRIVPEGYKRTRHGVLPKDWQIHIIEECLEQVSNPVDVEADTMYTQIGIRSHGKGLFYKEAVSGEALGNKSVFWIEPNCFVLNIVFAWEQAIGKTTQDEVGMIGSHRFPMYRPIEGKVDIDYLIYYLLTKRGTDILEAASPGGAGRNRTLGQERFMKSRIPLPPLPEQQKIAAILSAQDKVIELKEKRLAQKQRQKKYLMQQLLTGKKRLEGFEEEWETRRLNEICRYATEQGVAFENVYISTENMNPNLEGSVIFAQSESEIRGTVYCKDDILVANIRPYLRKVWKADREGVCSADVLVIRAKDIEADFLYHLIANDEFFSYVMVAAKGSKMPRGDKKHIMSLEVKVPVSPEERIAIKKVISIAEAEMVLLRQDLEQERQKKKALMQLLLTGIVRVNYG